MMEASREEDYVRQQLDLFVPDLLENSRYEQFVRRLLSSEKGTWVSVKRLCTGFIEADKLFGSLSTLVESELVVLWLAHPTDPDYAYVHFYLPDFFWTTSAVYNRIRLAQE